MSIASGGYGGATAESGAWFAIEVAYATYRSAIGIPEDIHPPAVGQAVGTVFLRRSLGEPSKGGAVGADHVQFDVGVNIDCAPDTQIVKVSDVGAAYEDYLLGTGKSMYHIPDLALIYVTANGTPFQRRERRAFDFLLQIGDFLATIGQLDGRVDEQPKCGSRHEQHHATTNQQSTKPVRHQETAKRARNRQDANFARAQQPAQPVCDQRNTRPVWFVRSLRLSRIEIRHQLLFHPPVGCSSRANIGAEVDESTMNPVNQPPAAPPPMRLPLSDSPFSPLHVVWAIVEAGCWLSVNSKTSKHSQK